MSLQDERYQGALVPSKFSHVYPRHRTYNGGDERLASIPSDYPDSHHSGQRYYYADQKSQRGQARQDLAKKASYARAAQGRPPVLVDLTGGGAGGGSDRLEEEGVRWRRKDPPPDPLHFPRDGLVFMRFYDDKCHCASCGALGSCFERLSTRYRQANFFDANVNANGRALGLLKIDYLPTVLAFRDRREIGRFFGTELNKLESFVHQMAHKL